MQLRVGDLFAGCGGLSLGFEKAGFNIVIAMDNWKPSNLVYEKNFNHEILDFDLTDVHGAVDVLQGYRLDMIIGGPPCQDFSHAGKRDEEAGRGDLTVSFANIVTSLKPASFVMENVDRLVKTRKYLEAREIFTAAGYGLSVKLLDASLCGVPQKRRRVFVIGELGGADNAFVPLLEQNLASKPMTMRDYFGPRLGTDYYYRHPRNYARRGIYRLDEPSATIRGVNRPLPKGYPFHPRDATKDLSKVRPLTTRERAEVQTFPERFIWEGSKTKVEQMIGNAVPVKLAEYVATAIKRHLLAKTKRRARGTPVLASSRPLELIP
jgi:DNA (cytosine-5)-methyltransferase 1